MTIRKKFFLPIAFLLAAVIYNCSGTSPEYREYQDALKIQIREMENVLNAGHNREFLANYVDPNYISSMGGVDAALLQFGNTRQQAVYGALKIARNMMPLYNEKSKTMTYTGTALPIPVVFKQMSGKWYLQSDYFKQ